MLRWMIFTALLVMSSLAASSLPAQSQDSKQPPAASANSPEKPAANPESSADDKSQATSKRPTRAEIIAANSVATSRYTNRTLGLSFEIPAGMTIEDAATSKQIEDAGHRAAYANDPASDPAHQQAQTQTIHLISLADHPSDPASSPAQILVLAYDLGSETFSNQEIVAGIAAGMSAEPGEWQVTDAPHEQEYGGAKFWQEGLKGAIQFGSHTLSVHVQILVTQCHGFAVAWNLSASSQQRLDALAKSLKTIQFAAACPVGDAPR